MQTVTTLKCPNCGGELSPDMKICDYCRSPVVITEFKSVKDFTPIQLNKYVASYKKTLLSNPDDATTNVSLGMIYFKLKLYQQALACFEKAMLDDPENADIYFYASICVFGGKKPFLSPRPIVDKALEYINASLMIEEKGIYYYFNAFIKYDYFKRKGYKVSPDYSELLQMANSYGFDVDEVNAIFVGANLQIPDCF